MDIFVNGKNETLTRGITLAEFLMQKELNVENIVVELNKVIIDKNDYIQIFLKDKDTLEILRFVGGG